MISHPGNPDLHKCFERLDVLLLVWKKFSFDRVFKISRDFIISQSFFVLRDSVLFTLLKCLESCFITHHEEFHHRKLTHDQIPGLTHEIFSQHLAEEKLTLPVDVFNQRKLTFSHRAMNGINFLEQIQEALATPITWKIEEAFTPVEAFPFRGSMDCLGISEHYLFLLDFKSSKEAASTNKDVENFESLQLWVYALAAKLKIPDFSKKQVHPFIIELAGDRTYYR